MAEERTELKMIGDTQETLYISGAESAKLPLALQEAFTQNMLNVILELEVIDKETVFPTNEQGQQLLAVKIFPLDDPHLPVVQPPFISYINVADLRENRIGMSYGFNAMNTAKEIVRLFRQYYRGAAWA